MIMQMSITALNLPNGNPVIKSTNAMAPTSPDAANDTININGATIDLSAAGNTDVQANLFDLKQPEDFGVFETDYMFVNVKDLSDDNIRDDFSKALGIPRENVILLSSDDFITNDLVSIKNQTEYIIDKVNEAGE